MCRIHCNYRLLNRQVRVGGDAQNGFKSIVLLLKYTISTGENVVFADKFPLMGQN